MTEDLHSVMQSATENLHPNISKLTSGGVERGVRKRRNRRITQIAGAAASVTAVFGAVAMIGAPGHGGAANVSAASGSGKTAVAPDTLAAKAGQPGQAKAPGKPKAAPVSGADMAKWLQQTLAPYHFTGEKVLDTAGTGDPAGPYATLRIGYGGQAGSASLSINREAWQDNGGQVPYRTQTTLPDGSHLDVFNGPEWPAGNGDPAAKRIDVSWYRTDGTLVDIQVLNAVQEKGGTTATDLGLTVAQATKVVESPVWNKAIASVLAEPTQNSAKTPGEAKAEDLQKKVPQSGTPNSSKVLGAAASSDLQKKVAGSKLAAKPAVPAVR